MINPKMTFKEVIHTSKANSVPINGNSMKSVSPCTKNCPGVKHLLSKVNPVIVVLPALFGSNQGTAAPISKAWMPHLEGKQSQRAGVESHRGPLQPQ